MCFLILTPTPTLSTDSTAQGWCGKCPAHRNRIFFPFGDNLTALAKAPTSPELVSRRTLPPFSGCSHDRRLGGAQLSGGLSCEVEPHITHLRQVFKK